MPSLQELKASSPAYAGMSDAEFAQRVYQKHYAGKLSFDDFKARVGMPEMADFTNVQGGSRGDLAERYRAAGIDPNGSDPAAGMSGVDRFRAGMGKSFVDAARGIRQAGTEALGYVAGGGTGNPVLALANQAAGVPRRLDNAGTQFADRSLAGQQATIDEARRLDEPLMDTRAGLAGNVAGYAAQALLPGAALRGTAAGRALLPTTVSGNALLGGAMGALQPVSSGDTRAGQAGAGAAFGAGGAVLAKGLGAAATRAGEAISDQARAVYAAAKARGIDLTPAQLSDSAFLRRLQGMLRSMPFTGAQGRYAQQVGALNRQVAATIGEEAPRVDSAVYARAKARQGRTFEDLTSRNALKVDNDLVRSLTNISDGAKVGGAAIKEQVDSAIDALYAQAQAGPNGVTIPGEAYQALDSQLNQIIKTGGMPSHYLGQVQRAMRRAMDASISPEDRAAWAQLRREYGNRKTLAPLVAKASDGDLSPASLMGAVTNSRSSKEAMASGARGELGELAKIGQRMKPPPSSGTAENLLAGGVFNPVNWPAYVAGLAVGAPVSRALDSNMLAGIIMRANPGMTRQAAAQIAQRTAAPAGQTYIAAQPPTAAPAASGIPNFLLLGQPGG